MTRHNINTVAEMLGGNLNLKTYLRSFKSEEMPWLHQTVGILHINYRLILEQIRIEWRAGGLQHKLYITTPHGLELIAPKKEIYKYFNGCVHTRALYATLRGRETKTYIWDRAVEMAEESAFGEVKTP